MAVIVTSLALVPLMLFAAFGVDVASFYSRASQLQRSADAAALAGTVWMPDLQKASQTAEESLRKHGFRDGVDGIEIEYGYGSTENSFKVEVTDTSATTYLSDVIGRNQEITRVAEAEYNIPIPLGSPLNYFGGDASKTVVTPGSTSYELIWPNPLDSWAAASLDCSVRTPDGAWVGKWWNFFGVRWDTTSLFGQPGADCEWTTRSLSGSTVASSVPPFSQTKAPLNQPCNVGMANSYGRWSGGVWTSGRIGSTLCRWRAEYRTDVTPGSSVIAADRSPGFWAAISGPGGVATQGNAYSVRCTNQLDTCSEADRNTMYRDTGFWYVVRMPETGASTTSIRIFDASYDKNGSGSEWAGDNDDVGEFDVEYRVYRQTNPFDMNVREPTPGQPGAGNNVEDSCWWKLSPTADNVAAFGKSWRTLCTVTPSNEDIYLINVKTSSHDGRGAGVNGYAVEAVSSGPQQPAVYAYGDMGMYNNIESGAATFYLAEVGPQYAGKTLVVDLWDAGDADGVAALTLMRPSTDLATPKPVVPVPASQCSYGADTPNPRHGSGQFGGATSSKVDDGTRPSGSDCRIVTANQTSQSGTPRKSIFNDQWLSIRIEIPSTYDCQLGVNPELQGGSCWWGIRYSFTHGATDATTWGARVEGNPVHLTR